MGLSYIVVFSFAADSYSSGKELAEAVYNREDGDNVFSIRNNKNNNGHP